MPELLVHIILHHILGEAAFFKHILVTNFRVYSPKQEASEQV